MLENKRETINGKRVLTCTYDSLDEVAAAAAKRVDTPGNICGGHSRAEDFNGHTSFKAALDLARTGWTKHLDKTLSLSESAVTSVESEAEELSFHAQWDVTGCEVDVARYLNGEPENMIDYPMTYMPKQGRIITLVASVAYSAAIDSQQIIQRGQIITAFALALSRLGISVELWVDWTLSGFGRNSVNARVRVLVKGANDTLDPARILFAYSHPAMLRQVLFGIQDGFPADIQKAGGDDVRGVPAPPIKDMPEGTIYLPELKSSRNVPNAAGELKNMLKQAGFITED